MSNAEELSENKDSSNELSLRLDKKNFAELILNFLGKKEKITYREKNNFIVRFNDIEQLYYLFFQKMEKERNVKLEHFLVTFQYNDNTSRDVSGIEGLKSYHETRDVYPVAVTLIWNVVLDFPNAPTIENQVVELTFLTKDKIEELGIGESFNGYVYLTIQHTNQAWGIEVLNLLKDKIKSLMVAEDKVCKVYKNILSSFFARIPGIWFALFIQLVLLTGMVVFPQNEISNDGYYYDIAKIIEKKGVYNEGAVALLASEKMKHADAYKVVDNLIHDPELKSILKEDLNWRAGRRTVKTWFYVNTAFLALLIFAWFKYMERYITHFEGGSYILATERANAVYNKNTSDRNSKQFLTVSIIIYTLIVGVITNFIYQMLQ